MYLMHMEAAVGCDGLGVAMTTEQNFTLCGSPKVHRHRRQGQWSLATREQVMSAGPIQWKFVQSSQVQSSELFFWMEIGWKMMDASMNCSAQFSVENHLSA